MRSLTRYDPFGLTLEPLDRVFEGWLKPVRMEGAETPQIRMDVKEDEKAYLVHAEIPGVDREAINVTVNGNVVTLSAEVKKEKEEKQGETVLRSERFYGTVRRSFTLEHDLDEAGATAKYDAGVLTLTLPKKVSQPTRKLEIH